MRADVLVLVAVGLAYLLVRIAWAPSGGVARYHLTDLLAGIAIPSVAALFFRGREFWERWARTLKGKLSVSLGAAIVWEGLMPLLSDQSTADFLDVASYLAGTLIQHCILRTAFARRRSRRPISSPCAP